MTAAAAAAVISFLLSFESAGVPRDAGSFSKEEC